MNKIKYLLLIVALLFIPFAISQAHVLSTYGQIENLTFPKGTTGLQDLSVSYYQNKDSKGTPADPSKDSPCYTQQLGNKQVAQYHTPAACTHNISSIKYVFINPVTSQTDTKTIKYSQGEVPDSQVVVMPNQFVVTNSDHSKICVQGDDSAKNAQIHG